MGKVDKEALPKMFKRFHKHFPTKFRNNISGHSRKKEKQQTTNEHFKLFERATNQRKTIFTSVLEWLGNISYLKCASFLPICS